MERYESGCRPTLVTTIKQVEEIVQRNEQAAVIHCVNYAMNNY